MSTQLSYHQMSRDMTKPTKWVCPVRPVWYESSLCAQWVAKDPSILHADSEDSDQTGRMPRLIWVFAGRTLILLVLSCRGSLIYTINSPPMKLPGHQNLTLQLLWQHILWLLCSELAPGDYSLYTGIQGCAADLGMVFNTFGISLRYRFRELILF